MRDCCLSWTRDTHPTAVLRDSQDGSSSFPSKFRQLYVYLLMETKVCPLDLRVLFFAFKVTVIPSSRQL
jgi:hypothetical protein